MSEFVQLWSDQKIKQLKVEGDVPQCPIDGDANGPIYAKYRKICPKIIVSSIASLS